MSKQDQKTLIISLIVMIVVWGMGVSSYAASIECNHPKPPECPTCPPPPPPCPDPPDCPVCPPQRPPNRSPCPPGRTIVDCCKIYLTFILDGKRYHDMERTAVPHRGDTILFADNVRGKVISVFWDASRKHAQLFCKTITAKDTDIPQIEENKSVCDITLQYIRDGKLIDSAGYCDVPRINDVIIFDDDSRLYITNVVWLTGGNIVVVSGTATRNDPEDSSQEAQVEQSGSGCFITAIK